MILNALIGMKKLEHQYKVLSILLTLVLAKFIAPHEISSIVDYFISYDVEVSLISTLNKLFVVISSSGALIGLVLILVFHILDERFNIVFRQSGFQFIADLFWGNIGITAINIHIMMSMCIYVIDLELYKNIYLLWNDASPKLLYTPAYLMMALSASLYYSLLKNGVKKVEKNVT